MKLARQKQDRAGLALSSIEAYRVLVSAVTDNAKIYGLGRFPVTLYKEQWVRFLAMADEIRNFIRENDSALKTKE